MAMSSESVVKASRWLGSGTLPVVLIAAVVQGWSLYALHLAIQHQHWPATKPGALLALYALAVFVPLTLQLLAEHARQRTTWLLAVVLALAFGYFGWHHGTYVVDSHTERFVDSGRWFPLAFVLGVLWLMILPFVQARLAGAAWRTRYETLFALAWRNKLTLAEAVLFTALFWLLLMLWQLLFNMLGIRFFKELFDEPIFVYPVTSLAFGVALHLIGSVERLTSVILEQLLNVLKWLAVIAGLILALFTVTLVFKLPGMIASGERAIGAAWLLWLVAVTVLLVNSAYRDGATEQPYPRAMAVALRCVIPLTMIIALTAVYALYLRVDSYGFTVSRVWASIVAAAACIYSVGYAIAARSKGRWMAGVARINVIAALFLIAVVALALTPVLSPYRIAAGSQYRLALEPPREEHPQEGRRLKTPLRYLRFDAGRYGEAKLRELSALQNHPRAETIRAMATAMLEQKNEWEPEAPVDFAYRLAQIKIYPAGRQLDAGLRERLEADAKNHRLALARPDASDPLGGVFIDLNADQTEEFVLIDGTAAALYLNGIGGWTRFGLLASNGVAMGSDTLLRAISAGDVHVVEPAWKELQLGHATLRLITRD
jgi:hypothetical protein